MFCTRATALVCFQIQSSKALAFCFILFFIYCSLFTFNIWCDKSSANGNSPQLMEYGL